jgi:hypothetical protein
VPFNFLVDILNHRTTRGIWSAGAITVDVIKQGLIVFAIGFESRREMPHRRSPQRRALRRNAHGSPQTGHGIKRFIEVQERHAGNVFDARRAKWLIKPNGARSAR